ncbi:YihY/virulence factor BrkB family protein [Sphingomonas sp. HF-S3]|uniref:YihY/virulence factor BrkB family protein n=1 Tax=Sphingomonas rustica TaxID=3103142 RepID=A0ABV0B488_9SPHN
MTILQEHGREAVTPWAIPLAGWKDIALRAWRESGQDNLGLIASGVAFCAVLAMVPMLGAVVLSYGIIATPVTVVENMEALTSMMPADAARLIGEQLANIVTTSDGKKGLGLVIAIAIALYGAMKGASAIITALNIAYDEDETRGFVKLNLAALAITIGAAVLALIAILSIAAMAGLHRLFPGAPAALIVLGKLMSYVAMAGIGAAAAATLYRYAPDRHEAKWRWLTPGSVIASLSWMIMTLGFGAYVANFGNYDVTYGSLGAAIVLLTWLYLSAYVLLLGAEFNCELERQTVRDTTRGAEQPMGARGAFAADTVASGSQPEPRPGPGPNAAATDPQPDDRGERAMPDVSRAPSLTGSYAAGRASARIGRIVGIGGPGRVPTLLATSGLVMLGKPNRAIAGLLLLTGAGALAWLGRERRA